MSNSLSLVMINPDAIQRNLVKTIEEKIKASGLLVIERMEKKIDRTTIRLLWPKIQREETRDKLFNYLGNKVLPIWLIKGEGAIEKIFKIKHEMRKFYCDDKYRSLFHCPDTAGEFEREYKILFSQ